MAGVAGQEHLLLVQGCPGRKTSSVSTSPDSSQQRGSPRCSPGWLELGPSESSLAVLPLELACTRRGMVSVVKNNGECRRLLGGGRPGKAQDQVSRGLGGKSRGGACRLLLGLVLCRINEFAAEVFWWGVGPNAVTTSEGAWLS